MWIVLILTPAVLNRMASLKSNFTWWMALFSYVMNHDFKWKKIYLIVQESVRICDILLSQDTLDFFEKKSW